MFDLGRGLWRHYISILELLGGMCATITGKVFAVPSSTTCLKWVGYGSKPGTLVNVQNSWYRDVHPLGWYDRFSSIHIEHVNLWSQYHTPRQWWLTLNNKHVCFCWSTALCIYHIYCIYYIIYIYTQYWPFFGDQLHNQYWPIQPSLLRLTAFEIDRLALISNWLSWKIPKRVIDMI